MPKKIKITNKVNQFNYLAIELLQQIGNSEPTQDQIDLIEDLLSMAAIKHQFEFDTKLNAKEIACLYWASRGKSSKETSHLLSISKSAVESYRKRIKRKLGCLSMAHAVFQGIRYGYVKHELKKEMESY